MYLQCFQPLGMIAESTSIIIYELSPLYLYLLQIGIKLYRMAVYSYSTCQHALALHLPCYIEYKATILCRTRTRLMNICISQAKSINLKYIEITKGGRFDSFSIRLIIATVAALDFTQCLRQSCGYSVIRAAQLHTYPICGHRGVFMYQIRLLWITGFRPPHNTPVLMLNLYYENVGYYLHKVCSSHIPICIIRVGVLHSRNNRHDLYIVLLKHEVQ